MLSHLDRKLWRDLRRMKGQAFAVAMVMGCGVAMMIMARSLIYSLESTRREYYEANRFAEVFVHLKRAPAWPPSSPASQSRSHWTCPRWMNPPAAWCYRCLTLLRRS
jgi:hypothetical protein